MKRHLIIALAVLCLAAPSHGALAQAYCPNLPDGADSHYVDNATARAVCLQNALAADTAAKNQLTQLQTTVDALKTDQLKQRMLDLTSAIAVPDDAADGHHIYI